MFAPVAAKSTSWARFLIATASFWRAEREVPQLLRGCGPGEVRFRRRTHRVKPSADVDLSVGFPAVVARAGRIGRLRVPFEHRELRIAALNHKPVNWRAGDCSADFTSEFLKRGHQILIVSKAARAHCNASVPWSCGGKRPGNQH